MASAAARMMASVTWFSQTYQLFQPMWGVRASVSPQTILNGREAVPRALAAVKVTRWVPGADREPVIRPVAVSSMRPSGSPSTPKVMGRSPVAGMV